MDQTFLAALLNIIVIDLVLSGDNAVVIAMAVQHLPPRIAKRAAIIGALGAIGLRVVFTALAAFLLAVPLLQALGGLLLLVIAYRLLVDKAEDEAAGHEVHSFGEAVKIILMADVVMSLDNILAVGGAAHGDMRLLVFGLMLSIPLVLFGSSFLTAGLRRWPWLGYVGSAVLAWTAGRMIVHDQQVHGWLGALNDTTLDASLPALGVVAVLAAGYVANRRAREGHASRGGTEAPHPVGMAAAEGTSKGPAGGETLGR